MVARPSAGAVVAWWDGDRLSFAVVVGEEKQRLRIVREGGREERIAPSRVGYVVEATGPAPKPTVERLREAGERARAAASRIARRAGEVDVPALWEVASASGEAAEDGVLAGLALGEATGESRAALAQALVLEGVRFVRRGEVWEPRGPEAVEAMLEQRRRTAERQVEKEAALAAIAGAEGAYDPRDNRTGRRYVEALEELAIRDEDATDSARSLALEALEAAGVRYDRPREGAFRLLRRLGRFDSDDENLEILRYGLRTEFPEDVTVAARAAASRGFDRDGRVDLTHLEVVTVDGVETREIDDGLSVEPRARGGWRLGIHISDPVAFVEPGGAVDREALSRSVTHYLPERRVTMLPPAISEEAASLVPGGERPALSFLADLSHAGRVEGVEIVRSVVRSRARLDYDGVDETLGTGEGPFALLLGRLREVSERLEGQRVAAGAIVLRAPEVEVRVQGGGIQLERRDPASRSQRIVAEAMILAGALAAGFCAERGIPAIYRRQDPPDRPLPEIAEGEDEVVAAWRLRRVLRRGEVSLVRGPHHALGLPAYAQATSPLRRYQDLATHRQIAAALAGSPPVYDAEALQRIAATTERAEAEGRRAEQASEKYWLLRWLEARQGEIASAVVVEAGARSRVILLETLLETVVPGLVGVEPGDRVRLRVARVVPRADLLVLRPI